MCSSSAALSEPDPVKANRCPQASGAKRPRSCGPSTRKVISRSLLILPIRHHNVVQLRKLPYRRGPQRRRGHRKTTKRVVASPRPIRSLVERLPYVSAVVGSFASPRTSAANRFRSSSRKERRGGCADQPASILTLSNPLIAPETLTYGCKAPVASSVTRSITLCGSRSSVFMT